MADDPGVIALDIALLLPAPLGQRCRALNVRLAPPPDGFRFDATHLPHITLVQLVVPIDALDELAASVERVLSAFRPLPLQTTTLAASATATTLGIATTPALTALHRELADAVAELETVPAPEAFTTDDGGPREADVRWVTAFRERSSYARFDPHITLGIGRVAAPRPAWSFVADTVALCQLGRFCTCRRVIRSWTLTAPG